ncbi:unnamed protein product [Didymodactylos carnosus]|uniref:ABC transmembrane type-1 domain-containing protein n=1 Tax=Didymodactylos carnosus TaxID=1234261 RepID=A0A814W8W1_9BILA|nr:unnamed protein product [Didymodactylos carnosus]CAF1198116.1 unnamed protein product [Didymodactylos carnosus]CAF3628608.1 unnamed protein product [Didymodactylos carnosus]CAF3962522.1 unnamed protein product [Didymodactylos carnosus]
MRLLPGIICDNWRLTHLYFYSEEKWYARSMIVILIIMEFCSIGLGIVLSYWNNSFFNALQKFDYSAFIKLLLCENAYYGCCLHTQIKQDNPDQRISIDIGLYIQQTYDLCIGILNSSVTFISYVLILWSLSGKISIPITNTYVYELHGGMVWAAIFYAGLGTLITMKIGHFLIRLNYNQELHEADFRFALIRLRENVESIALYHGESYEQTNLNVLYQYLMANSYAIMLRKMKLNWFTNGYNNASIVFPFLVASPRYFSKTITLGDLTQISSSFNHVQSALSFILNSYSKIALWRSSTKRLIEFENNLQYLHNAKELSNIRFGYSTTDDCINIRNLTINLPMSEETLINHFDLTLVPRQSLLITGQITFPLNDTISFLPQKPYMPLGTLLHALTYPQEIQKCKLSDIDHYLSLFNLNYLHYRLTDVSDWSRVLSLGEQQKMSFIRILLQKPMWIFLDEATSSLDEISETLLYSTLINEIPNSTIISVGHRSNLRKFHQKELAFSKLS